VGLPAQKAMRFLGVGLAHPGVLYSAPALLGAQVGVLMLDGAEPAVPVSLAWAPPLVLRPVALVDLELAGQLQMLLGPSAFACRMACSEIVSLVVVCIHLVGLRVPTYDSPHLPHNPLPWEER
jgi:hypothetical protein